MDLAKGEIMLSALGVEELLILLGFCTLLALFVLRFLAPVGTSYRTPLNWIIVLDLVVTTASIGAVILYQRHTTSVALLSSQSPPKLPVYVRIANDRWLYIGDRKIADADLLPSLGREVGGRKDRSIFVRVDPDVPSDRAASIIGQLKTEGYTSLFMVAPQQPATRR
jgi:biopolymer transport protein ExbD